MLNQLLVYNILLLLFAIDFLFATVSKKLIENNNQKLIIELHIDALTEADLYNTSLIIGLPNNELPSTNIEYFNKSLIPFKSKHNEQSGFNWINKQKLKNLQIATLSISPFSDTNYYFKKIKISIDFQKTRKSYRTANASEKQFLKNRIINWDVAKSWILKNQRINNLTTTTYEGKWFQFFIENDDVYSISYELLSNAYGEISIIDPRSISIFMNNELGRSRTQELNQPIPDNLKEISLLIKGEEDGSFDPEDQIIFYGKGASGFDIIQNNIEWHQNLYFNTNSCWLFIPDDINLRGKRILQEDQPETGLLIDYGILSDHIEIDITNLNASGLEWLSDPIAPGTSKPIIINLSKPKLGSTFNLIAKIKGNSNNGSSSSHEIKIFFNNLNGIQIGETINWSGNSFRTILANNQATNLINGTNIFYLLNSTTDPNSLPYLDFFEITYARELSYEENYTFFSPVQNQDIRFNFSGLKPDNINFWNITDHENIKMLNIDESNFSNVSNSTNHTKRFVLFNSDNIISIDNIQLKNNHQFNNLRQTNIQADYIIIGPDEFRTATTNLLELRNPAIYASLENIYTEFSAGNPDPMAIRSFIQWTQEQWIMPRPNNALLLGDGGYDYRNINGNSSIVVPTIQVQSNRSYATDDLLATTYGNIPEISTGRYPAKNIQEVYDFIEKVEEIETNPMFGPWRQKVTLIADDAARPEPNHGSIATGQSHTINSEEIANLIPSFINIEKLYMIEYPEVSDASAYGVIKPAATQALFNSLNSGTGIISYIGHGSPYQLAQEKLLDLNRGDINQINIDKTLPLWIVGTCSFGWFDDPLNESFAEELIRAKMNAAAMVISTTRPITVVGNERYTKNLFENIFYNGNVSNLSIGSILQSIKDGSSESQYFQLFGDPAMLVPLPKDTVLSLSITPDTLETLEKGTFYGLQNIISNDGIGYIHLIDADRSVTRDYEISSETYSLSFLLPGATLFRGKFSISNSNFEGTLRIPQDISYSNDPSKLLLYINNDKKDAIGIINSIPLIGGANTQDNQGPNIIFETSSGVRLEDGDHLTINNNLIIRISDPLGINLTNEPGHEIILTDLNNEETNNLTNKFYYDTNSIITGTINYPTNNNELNLKVKAWDNANNPNEKNIILYRTEINKLKIYNVYNYPNPFTISTQFTFELTKTADISIEIYTLGGKKIKSIKRNNSQIGFNIINWNGLDTFGDNIANGVYLYRLKATDENGANSFIGRCAKFK
ncbi:MAG: hypothetical protein CMG55_08675 [Candidatus Marinimicrobia bacterium]|nr:hypothetical protein [Candidatus Neomarinimicrobiota bacterium]